MNRVLFLLILVFFACLSCKHQPFPAPMQTADICDTNKFSYSKDIQPILAANCYRCHATDSTLTGGLDLENFQSLKTYLKNGFRGDGIYGSKLYHCMLHAQSAVPMPPEYIVDSCSLIKMRKWLAAGGLDN